MRNAGLQVPRASHQQISTVCRKYSCTVYSDYKARVNERSGGNLPILRDPRRVSMWDSPCANRHPRNVPIFEKSQKARDHSKKAMWAGKPAERRSSQLGGFSKYDGKDYPVTGDPNTDA